MTAHNRAMRIYIAGPTNSVGGNFNFPLFDECAARLRAAGCEVFSPADHARKVIGPLEVIKALNKKTMASLRKVLLKDELVWICEKADLLLMLPGSHRSRGATAEKAVAVALDIPVRDMPNIILHPGNKNVDISEKIGELVKIET
jgi:nucleoside 2-deoxyribosyltransferase